MPKILQFDIETAPAIGEFYDFKNPYNIIRTLRPSYMLSVAWMIRGEKTIYCKQLPDFKLYKKDKHDDYELVKFLHDLISKADFLIGHNGDNFDIKYSNARFIKHRLGPTPPRKTRDTLKLSRKITHVPSHRLDALAQFYEIGQKLPHTGKHLWADCTAEKYIPKSWNTMKRYNKHDVFLLDALATLILPWDNTSSLNPTFTTRKHTCPKLGCGSYRIWKQGVKYVKGGFKQQYQCLSCLGWFTDTETQPLDKIQFSS